MIAALLFAVDGCSVVGTASGPVTGSWGGMHASLTLTGADGTITYDCAHGGLRAPLMLDGDGNFDVPGVHVRETGGPVRIDAVPDSLPARYFGQVAGSRMTLRVAVGADTLGPFDLRLGAPAQLVRCL
jgi:hypothetical protein